MRRTRARYHYALRQVRRDQDDIVLQRMADALINDPSRSFWSENTKQQYGYTSVVVNGFLIKLKFLRFSAHIPGIVYKCPIYDAAEMQEILTDVESQLSREAALSSDHICSPQEVASAISKLNPHKNDGGTGLSSDHFIFSGPDLPVHSLPVHIYYCARFYSLKTSSQALLHLFLRSVVVLQVL